MMSPSFTRASGPPSAASGMTCPTVMPLLRLDTIGHHGNAAAQAGADQGRHEAGRENGARTAFGPMFRSTMT